jgi:argininosuccinate lyase
MTRLWDKGLPLSERYDVRGSIAHAEMLAATGLISDEDCNAIRGGLKQLEGSFEAGDWSITLQDEDVHTALESRLTRAIGDAGARLHLGRSRNDQVLTALRLYLLEAADDLVTRIDALRKSVAKLTERQGDIPLPGYTHMQQAMPSSVTLWCGGFDEAFADARDGIGAAKRRMDKNPLGSAAGYGTPGLPLDREMTTASLGFAATQTPVTAAQLSRGKAESGLLFEITLLLQDVGRMAADLLIFYMQEFGYVALAADVTTGSSIMPQKRNPDVLLPSGYHRDLQRLKSPLFRGIDLAVDSVDILAHVLDGIAFVPSHVQLDEGVYATEEAYRLVREEGIPFRDAYRQVAKRYAGR